MSSPQVDDETYRLMSEAAYLDLKKDTVEDLPGWEVLEDYKSNSISGFDAVTFTTRKRIRPLSHTGAPRQAKTYPMLSPIIWPMRTLALKRSKEKSRNFGHLGRTM